jgi:hypothetical protein
MNMYYTIIDEMGNLSVSIKLTCTIRRDVALHI